MGYYSGKGEMGTLGGMMLFQMERSKQNTLKRGKLTERWNKKEGRAQHFLPQLVIFSLHLETLNEISLSVNTWIMYATLAFPL